MGIKFGEIDANQIVDNEFRIMVLERVVQRLVSATPEVRSSLKLEEIRHEVIAELQKKYPNSGVSLKG